MENKNPINNIKAIVCDIDGVLTDGSIICLGPRHEDLVRVVDAKDSFALRVATGKGLITGIISGGDTPALYERCRHMKVPHDNIHLGTRGKLATFRQFCQENGVEPHEVAYFGDDIPDTQVLRACGLGIAPSDACPEAKAAADYVTTRPGGHGCVREGIEMIMKAQDLWHFDEERYDQLY